MSRFDQLIQTLKEQDMIRKKQLLEYLLQIIKQKGRTLSPADKTALLEYAYSEVEVFLEAIANAATYREKDSIFACEDLILGLIMHLCPVTEIPQDTLARIQQLVETVSKERYIENTIDEIFAQDPIGEPEVRRLLDMVRQTSDEYRKGVLYSGLIHHQESVEKLTDCARDCIAGHIVAEFERYLSRNPLSEECVNNLELAADACVGYANDPVVDTLRKVMALGLNNVNYYAVKTLLCVDESVPAAVISSLARDLEYANLTYGLLTQYGKQNLFPREYTAPEYLAKSDMIRWLLYPTELGKMPDEIVYLGRIKPLLKKEEYHVFKFRSDSDTLGDERKNRWLIGWSSEEGGTFSHFDAYAPYENMPAKKALRLIKKKIIG